MWWYDDDISDERNISQWISSFFLFSEYYFFLFDERWSRSRKATNKCGTFAAAAAPDDYDAVVVDV